MQKCITLVTFVALVVVVRDTEAKGNQAPTSTFHDFKAFHGKEYENAAEESYRKSVFEKNAKVVAAHNEAFKRGTVSYTKELNEFADIEARIFKTRNGFKGRNKTGSVRSIPLRVKRQSPPPSFDWRDQNKVSPVKNQGNCGSCWAFSATGSMEAQVLMNNSPPETFSEQDLVSCDTNDNGCRGGNYESAWQWIEGAGGIVSDTTYPYTSGNDETGQCVNDTNFVANVAYFQDVGNDPDSMKAALVQYGPLSIALDATDWQLASDGIYSCSQVNIDHAVLLVGYSGKDYWIVKNSWGSGWGDNGYFKLSMTYGQDCGVTQYPAYVQLQ